MSGIPFENTRRGAEYYDHHIPKIAKSLERIANALERADAALCQYCDGAIRLLNKTTTTTIHLNTTNGAKALTVECIPCPEIAKCAMHNIPDRMVMAIAYCPICGRKL